MLRLVALGLLLANLLYFGWTLGWLDAVVGISALGDREPQRMERQLRPDLIRLAAVDPASSAAASPAQAGASAASAVVEAASPSAAPASAAPASEALAASAPAAASAAVAASPPPSAPVNTAKVASAPIAAEALACLEAGPFAATDLGAAEATVRAAAPDATWTQRQAAGGAEWMIYMGPYPDDGWIERKKGELSRIRGGVSYDVVGPTASFGRGISLGRFASQAAAEKRLQELRPRGIRTARVIQSADGPARTFLRIAKAEPALIEKLTAIQWPAGQAGFKPCPAPR